MTTPTNTNNTMPEKVWRAGMVVYRIVPLEEQGDRFDEDTPLLRCSLAATGRLPCP